MSYDREAITKVDCSYYDVHRPYHRARDDQRGSKVVCMICHPPSTTETKREEPKDER